MINPPTLEILSKLAVIYIAAFSTFTAACCSKTSTPWAPLPPAITHVSINLFTNFFLDIFRTYDQRTISREKFWATKDLAAVRMHCRVSPHNVVSSRGQMLVVVYKISRRIKIRELILFIIFFLWNLDIFKQDMIRKQFLKTVCKNSYLRIVKRQSNVGMYCGHAFSNMAAGFW